MDAVAVAARVPQLQDEVLMVGDLDGQRVGEPRVERAVLGEEELPLLGRW